MIRARAGGTQAPRGQAAVEMALASLIFVTLITAGMYFGEVTFGSLKVTEAGQSALWDMTHYKHHSMLGLTYQTNPQIANAANEAEADTERDYRDFDGRTSVAAAASMTQVMTRGERMTIECSRGGGADYNPNPFGLLSYDDNNGATCNARATFLTTPNMPRSFADQGASGLFKQRNFARAQLVACASGKASAGNCNGRFGIMLDDWGLTGPDNGEWNPCPGLPFGFGVPCPNNPSYWWTAFKGYLTSYTVNAAFKPVMFQMPASLMSQWVAFANPMGGIAGLIAFPGTGNESTFYMSFTGSLPTPAPFSQPLWVREGFFFWETTPFGMSLALPYAVAFGQRVANGGCYLGKKCR